MARVKPPLLCYVANAIKVVSSATQSKPSRKPNTAQPIRKIEIFTSTRKQIWIFADNCQRTHGLQCARINEHA